MNDDTTQGATQSPLILIHFSPVCGLEERQN